jgi:hypothetical protein
MAFINRKFELKILNERLDDFKHWTWLNTSHIAFLWLRRTGKTYLVKYFYNVIKENHKDIIPLFIDISKLTESIKYFCDSIILEFAKSYKNTYLDLDLDLFFHEFSHGDVYLSYKNYDSQTDNTKIFDSFLKLLTIISSKQKLLIIFDEFQEILEFTKIKWLKTIDSIFRSELQNQWNIFYIITLSYPTILRDLIQNPNRKLYSHFDIYDIKNFDKESSIQLIDLLKKDLDHSQKIALYKSCNWNPYLISLILQKVDLWLLWDLKENFKNLLFDRKWAIYNHYEYILEESLSKIQNSIVLKSILKEIALSNDWLSLKELSDNIWYTSQQVLFWLKQLLRIDIIYQNAEKRWKFQDILFSYFVAYSLWWVENYEFEKNTYYTNEVNRLQERLNDALSELWKTKEFELYYEIKENQWKEWNGIKLPIFKIIKKNFYTEHGDEIDLYCETLRGKKRVFELKYKSKQIWNKEIESFLGKLEADRYIYISKSWFSDKVDKEEWEKKNVWLIYLK